MKITKNKLKQIIKEEMGNIVKEDAETPVFPEMTVDGSYDTETIPFTRESFIELVHVVQELGKAWKALSWRIGELENSSSPEEY
jgi:hypothetical protein